MNLHQEHHFEREICAHLSAQGWLHAESADVGLQLLAETQISERPNHGFADLPAIEAEGTAAEASLKALRQQMLDKLPEDWADDNTGVVRLRRSRMCRKPLRSGVVRELIYVERQSTGKPKRARNGKQGKLTEICHVSATNPS